MQKDDKLRQIKTLIRDQHALAKPRVDHLRPEVRTGDSIVLGARGSLPADEAVYVGKLVVEWGFDVRADKEAQFFQWLRDSEADLATEAQTLQGVAYRGTYAVANQSDKGCGNYRTIWTFVSLGAMEVFNNAVADGNTALNRLVIELRAFRDKSDQAGRSQAWYQPAAATIRY